VSSIASLALGEYSTHYDSPDAYTPMESATTPTEDTPNRRAGAKGLVGFSWAQLLSGLGIFITTAILSAEREK
jgi:hypothetical protein